MNRSPWRVKNLQVDEMRGLEFLDKTKHVGSRIFRLFLWIVTYGDDINFARCNHRLNIAANPSLFLRRESSFLADEKRYLVLSPPRDRDFRTHGLLAMHRGGENTVWQVSAKFSSATTVRPFPSRTSKLGYAWFEINGELARQSTKPWSTSFCCCCCCCWTDAGSLLFYVHAFYIFENWSDGKIRVQSGSFCAHLQADALPLFNQLNRDISDREPPFRD